MKEITKYNNRRYYNSVYYQYDKMGNVTSLTKSGERDNNHYGTIDILDYSYDGNQVVKVADKESGPHFKGAFHFVDGANEDITSTQRYKYNGKELDRMFGLDWYDYGARMYDPCMIRWRSLDPLCEKYYSISPYAYCANDPINFLDKDGKRPSLYEAALIARHVYYGKGHLVGNWQLHGKIIEKDNGLQYGIYYRKLKNGNMDYVLAFAGTNDKRDIEQDINQALGNGSVSQFGNAKSISEKFQTSHKNGDQTIIGHSLGGGLATIGSLTTGIPAITFNPAALHQNTKRLLDIDRAEDSQILNFVVKGEIVDKVQKVLRLQTDGHTFYISNKESEEMDSLDKHKIDNVIQILKKKMKNFMRIVIYGTILTLVYCWISPHPGDLYYLYIFYILYNIGFFIFDLVWYLFCDIAYTFLQVRYMHIVLSKQTCYLFSILGYFLIFHVDIYIDNVRWMILSYVPIILPKIGVWCWYLYRNGKN